ncbi:MAG: 16S rRNA (uracil(1498)-N(3))-methyltransferase [Rhizobiales bacterium]|nr:16S rRNA (uracil(1498)-N(3))-methyltransferase [Hyphomicrobiales bacterium]
MTREYHKLSRLYLDAPIIKNSGLQLNNDQWHYVCNVMRLNEGDQIMIFNGKDGEWLSEIKYETKKRILLNPIKQTKPQPDKPQLVYAFAPLKKGRVDYMIQKATELGVGILQPIITDHTIGHKVKLEKYVANAIEAAEQCTMLNIPTIKQAIKFDTFIHDFATNYQIIFCDEAAKSQSPLNDIGKLKSQKICVLIGPEGGFSSNERAALLQMNNSLSISLGPRIMRADTAAIAALTLVQATIGDW